MGGYVGGHGGVVSSKQPVMRWTHQTLSMGLLWRGDGLQCGDPCDLGKLREKGRQMALVERKMGREARDEEILRLRRKGFTLTRIARRVEMSPSGVKHALGRLERRGC